MKFEFYFIGKTTEKYLSAGIENYRGKLVHYMNTEIKIVPASAEKDKAKAMQDESRKFLKSVSPHDFVVVLDERGKQLSSVELATAIQETMNKSYSKIIFAVGSAYGTSAELKSRANLLLSISRLTFTHQMVRLIVAEQVYRAMTILKGESYHHE
jgi:23S rRNA (pseudouridine1915-N3)-methyltransferase